jgi:hypothetical protein
MANEATTRAVQTTDNDNAAEVVSPFFNDQVCERRQTRPSCGRRQRASGFVSPQPRRCAIYCREDDDKGIAAREGDTAQIERVGDDNRQSGSNQQALNGSIPHLLVKGLR